MSEVVIEFENADEKTLTNPDFNSSFTIEFESGDTKTVNVHLSEEDLSVKKIDCTLEEVDGYIKFLRSCKLKVDLKSVKKYLKQ